jgi:biopolymer transport protein TolR
MNVPNQPRRGPLSEINIIPLVDVMLVLLIIFMIAAPMMQQGLPVDLPKVTAKPLPSKEEIQILTITKENGIVLNAKRLDIDDLKAAVQLLYTNKSNKELFIKADSAVPYGVVVRCMGIVREAGVDKVNIVTKPPDEK